jgi:hypothetical protein
MIFLQKEYKKEQIFTYYKFCGGKKMFNNLHRIKDRGSGEDYESAWEGQQRTAEVELEKRVAQTSDIKEIRHSVSEYHAALAEVSGAPDGHPLVRTHKINETLEKVLRKKYS